METAASGGLPLPIPEGPFFDVLSRLSVKDLHRSTGVSREWRDVFTNFPNSRKKLPQTLQGVFYVGCGCRRHGHGGDDGDSDGNGDGTRGDEDSRDDGSDSNGGGDTDEDGHGTTGDSNGDTDGDGDGSGNSDCHDGSDTEDDGDGSGNKSNSSGGGSDRDEDEDGSGGGDGNDDGNDVGVVRGRGSASCSGNYGLHFLDLLVKSMPVPDDTDTDLDFIPLPANVGSTDLLCSCNGLLLFGCAEGSESYHSLGYIVCNPATKQWVEVPSSGWVLPNDEERDEEFESTFLFFDPAVPSRFLLIQFWHDEDATLEGVHIYSSETGEWSSDRSSDEWKQFANGGEWGDKYGVTVQSCMGSCFLNGMLHFLVRRMTNNDVLVVAMDGEGSVRRIMRWPLDMFSDAVFIGQSQGRLHCISANFINEDEDQRNRIMMVVHVLQDYDAEEWIRKLGIWGGDLSGREECKRKDYEVVAFHPDADLVYFVDRRKGQLIEYDMGGNSRDEQVLRLCTLGPDCGAATPYVPCFSRSSAFSIRHKRGFREPSVCESTRI